MQMKQKNLAIELMKRLLSEEIRIFGKTALVKSEEFSKRMKRIMDSYRKSVLYNARSIGDFQIEHHDAEVDKVLNRLIELARDIVKADKMGEEIGLTKEETSFYQAIISPEKIKNLYEDQTLIEMAKELTKTLEENESIDWQYKQSGRARMRSVVRRLLKKYDYPPKEMSEALDVVLKQCEHWTERRI